MSVCVQTYCHGPYIADCLDGILAQKTDFQIEVIVGEDDSTDDTRQICQDYAARNPEIRLFLRDRKDVIHINGSPTGRYNYVENLKAARGKYVAFCEGDDYWTDPLKLQKQVDFLEENKEYVISCHDVNEVDESGDFVSYQRKPFRKATGDFVDLLNHHFIPTASMVFRNHLVSLPGWFKQAISADVPFCLLLASKGDIAYGTEKMATYRHHGGGASKNLTRKQHWLRHRIFIYESVNQELSFKYNKQIRSRIRRLGFRQIGSNLKRLVKFRNPQFLKLLWQDFVIWIGYLIKPGIRRNS